MENTAQALELNGTGGLLSWWNRHPTASVSVHKISGCWLLELSTPTYKKQVTAYSSSKHSTWTCQGRKMCRGRRGAPSRRHRLAPAPGTPKTP